MNRLDQLRNKKGFICDMDGVIYHGNQILPGVKEFIDWLYREDKKFLFLTNNSGKTPQELQEKLSRMGLHVDSSHFYTSALATANFIAAQTPNAKVFVIGEPGLYNALYEKGIILDDTSPDYVVIGESYSYNYENICRAVRHIQNGARLIGTNSDLTGPTEQGIIPACRAFVKPIEMVTGKEAYYIGKPNPLMMRTGLNMLGVHSKEAAIIGDRMDTDIVSGIESGLDTVLVLSGVSTMETVKTFPYRPRLILNGVGEIPTPAKADKSEKEAK
ncbi:HAD-IIA family hydrolase [Anaerotignum sp.]|uniref:HAD-IIA family hydrolase n=1 Tax=Anaerotignum sp. TaxID=2039241 RepID=UPI0039A03BC7